MKYKCYLPYRGELGWMLSCFVKKFHSDSSDNKIICCKKGHECLFPTAVDFFYDWQDVQDFQKAGILEVNDEEQIIEKINNTFINHEINFIHLSEVGWHNKHDYAQYTFIPQSKQKFGLITDVIITPRKRVIEPHRNWTQQNWQSIINAIVDQNMTVGVCGTKDTSFDLTNVKYKSYDYVDIDSDVELINNSKLVVTQESGLQYLSFMCEKPTFCIDHYHKAHGADLHRNTSIPFKEVSCWLDPKILIKEILIFLKK